MATAVMQQFYDAKAQAPGALMLFRLGDFYETFHEDAEQAARLLGLALTARDKGENPIPMAGFPHHQLDSYLRKLVEAGVRVAICEQMEDASESKGLIRRELTRVITPGTLADETLLDPARNNYLAAVWRDGAGPGAAAGLAWLDIASDTLHVAALPADAVADELARLEPAELLHAEGAPPPAAWLTPSRPPALTPRPAAQFHPSAALARLREQFGVATFAGFGLADDHPGLRAAGALWAYLADTQKAGLPHVSKMVECRRDAAMAIDAATRRSLEIARPLQGGGRAGSLLGSVDRTVTAGGARKLAEWLLAPLVDAAAIRARHDAVAAGKDDPPGRARLRTALRSAYDLERLSARIATGRASPRDLAALRDTLAVLPAIKAELPERNAGRKKQATLVSANESPVQVWVVPTNEEREIALQSIAAVS